MEENTEAVTHLDVLVLEKVLHKLTVSLGQPGMVKTE